MLEVRSAGSSANSRVLSLAARATKRGFRGEPIVRPSPRLETSSRTESNGYGFSRNPGWVTVRPEGRRTNRVLPWLVAALVVALCWPATVGAVPVSLTAVSAGENHACGIMSDRTLTCWGDNRNGESTPPAGAFRQVSAGNRASCGIRLDYTIDCWPGGDPSGTFTAVSAGGGRSCAVRTDGSLYCWGGPNPEGQDPPSGTFEAVSVGSAYSCAVRNDATIACWGLNDHGQASAPSGTFKAVTAGNLTSCGLRTDGGITCWGADNGGARQSPAGTFQTLSSSRNADTRCAVRTDRSLVCWGSDFFGHATPPAGSFDAVAVGDYHSCGLKSDGSAVCWGSNDRGQLAAPDGRTYMAISADHGSGSNAPICGIHTDGVIACWAGTTQTPAGTYTAVGTGGFGPSCALRSDRVIVCFPGTGWSPSGTYSALSVGSDFACGVHDDRTLACWGGHIHGAVTPPAGTFTKVAAGYATACGIRDDNTVECWGRNGSGEASPPVGTFLDVAVGGYRSCGVRSDTWLACWPSLPLSLRLKTVSLGYYTGCGLTIGDEVACWHVGTGGPATATTPRRGSFRSVNAGDSSVCAIRRDETATCWGDSAYDLRGSETPSSGDAPVVVPQDPFSPERRSAESVAQGGPRPFAFRSLASQLSVQLRSVRIRVLLRKGGFRLRFRVPRAGRLRLRMYQVTHGKRRLIGSGARSFVASGQADVLVKLTARGRSAATGRKTLRLFTEGVFTTAGSAPVRATTVAVLKR